MIARKFEANWEAEAKRKKKSKDADVGVVTVLWKTFGCSFIMGSLLTVVPDLLDVSAPTILR